MLRTFAGLLCGALCTGGFFALCVHEIGVFSWLFLIPAGLVGLVIGATIAAGDFRSY